MYHAYTSASEIMQLPPPALKRAGWSGGHHKTSQYRNREAKRSSFYAR